jgi:hypothetical protein
LIIHLHEMEKLIICGALPLPSPYTFMACPLDWGYLSGRWKNFFLSSPCPNLHCDPPSLLCNRHHGPLSPGVKWPGHEADNIPPASVIVKKAPYKPSCCGA